MSEERKHTKGPWRVYHANNGIGVTSEHEPLRDSDGDGVDICSMDNEGVFGLEQTYANARLIAAAPEMHEALKAARQALYDHGTERFIAPAVEQIDAALAKARGETA